MESRLSNLTPELGNVPPLIKAYVDGHLYQLAKDRDAMVGYSCLGYGQFWEYRDERYNPIFRVQPLHPGHIIELDDDDTQTGFIWRSTYKLVKNSVDSGEWWLATVRYKNPPKVFYAVALCSTGEKFQIEL